MGISNYAREKTPKYNEETALKPKKRNRKLVNLLYKSRAEVIMDDEKYFCFDGDNVTLISVRYYTNDKEKCSDDVYLIGKIYPKKMYIQSGYVKALFTRI